MKVSSAVIKLVLRTNKVLADGSHPIMLKVSFNGSKEKATSFSCTVKYWNKKDECVKKGYPNYQSINAVIQKMKGDAIDRRNKFELQGIAYTPSMILEKDSIVSKDDFKSLMDKYTVSLSPTTKKTWKAFYNSLARYKKIEKIQEVSLEVVKGYSKHLEDSGMKDSTIKMTLAKLSALCKFAVEEGIIKESPFKRFNIHKKYKTNSNILHIDKCGIDVLKEMLMERLIVREDKSWHYNHDAIDEFVDRRSDLFVLAFFLFGYCSSGLAPIDLCQLKVKDMTVVEENGISYYRWSIKRQKTNVAVDVMISHKNFFAKLIFQTMLMFRNGEYLLPVLDGVENDRLKIYQKLSNWLSNNTDVLREWFKKANERIIQMNVENHTNLPLINEKCTFYNYRSSFAMAFMEKGGNLLQLCTLLGRGVNASLKSYVRQLSKSQDVASAVEIMDD